MIFFHLFHFFNFFESDFSVFIDRNFVTMRRKRTAEKLNQIVADNDFVTEAYEKKDQVLQKRDFFIEKYIKIQKKSLNL